MTDLVTGADGFVGQHLVAHLLTAGRDVVGAVHGLPPRLTTLSTDAAARVRWVSFDLEDRDTVRDLVRRQQFDRIFHLAAFSSVARSLDDPAPAFRVNVIGTLFLFHAVSSLRREGRTVPRILVSGSGDIYGSSATRCRPLREECPAQPLNAYAVSKAAQEQLGLQFHRAEGLPVIVTRSFNHTGPGQRPPFVAADFAVQVVQARRAGGTAVIRTGNLDVRRDFTDVRDVVRAYVALLERGRPGGVYNVCSGRARRIGELVDLLATLTDQRLQVEVDPDRVRGVEVPEAVGDHTRLSEATGWQPAIDLLRSLADLVSFLERAVD